MDDVDLVGCLGDVRLDVQGWSARCSYPTKAIEGMARARLAES